jgi:hypothetical protein
MSWKNPLWMALRRGSRRRAAEAPGSRSRAFRPAFESLEDRSLPAPFTPGNLIVLQAGTGATGQTTGQLFLNEYPTTPGGAIVQQQTIPNNQTVGGTGNQPITIDLQAAAGNGQLSRSYDGSVLTFGGLDAPAGSPASGNSTVATGSADRVLAVVGNQINVSSATWSGGTVTINTSIPHGLSANLWVQVSGFTPTALNGQFKIASATASSFTYALAGSGSVTATGQIQQLDTTTHGQFYVGDDNRGGIAESATGPIYSVGHPNQAGGAVSQGVHYFATEGPSIGTQVSASQNIRGGTIGFENRFYGSTAGMISSVGNVAGIFTMAPALPTDANANPAADIQVVPALFTASKLGGVFLADLNGDGITDNNDRLYLLDDGTVGGAGTGGLYVATWNDANTQFAWNTPTNAGAVAAGLTNHWGLPVRLGDAPPQDTNVGNMRGLAGTVIYSNPGEVDLYTTAFDDKENHVNYLQGWVDTSTGFSIASASATGGPPATVTITLPAGQTLPANYSVGTVVQINGVGASTGGGALSSGFNGAFAIASISGDRTQFTYADNNATQPSGTVNNQGSFDATLTPTTLQSPGTASTVIGTKHVAALGLRGVAFAPVAPTSVSLGQSPSNPLTPGTSVTLTATLTNAQIATLSGQVAFINENIKAQGAAAVLGFATIVGNQASLTLPTGLVGNTFVSAYFAGGGVQALASAKSNVIQVQQAGSTASTTSVASSLSAAAVGRQVTLTATVTSGATGTVSFYNGSVSLANLISTATISGTTAAVTTSFSTAGSVTVVAQYNGNATFAASQGTTTVNVAANATATVTSSANNVALNATPTYTVTINGNATLGDPSVGSSTVVFTIVSAVNLGTNGAPSVLASSAPIALSAGASNTATATWSTAPALSVPGSYFVTVSYSALGASNPYNAFATDTTTSVNGVAFIENVKQAFTPGNLVAVQRGDGTVNLGSNGYLVLFDEYTPAGGLVQKIAMPNIDGGSAHALLLSGQASTPGLLNRSADGRYLTVFGYDVPVGKTFVTSTFPFQFDRTVARVALDGTVDTSTHISTTPSSSVPFEPLDVVSKDGTQFWLLSSLNEGNTTETGILYALLGATSAVQIGPAGEAGASIGIAGGQLYVQHSNETHPVGTGLPTTGPQTLGSLPNLLTAYSTFFPSGTSPEQFLFLNTADGTSNNPNLLYVADQANGLLKFWKDGSGNWQYGGPGGTFGQKLLFAGGVTGVAGFINNPGSASATVQLYVTGSNIQGANPNQIAAFLDGHGAPAGTTGTGVDQGFTSGNFSTTAFVGQFNTPGNPSGPNGNENFAGLAFVPGFTTTTALMSSVNPSTPGQSVTFTATVTAPGSGGNVPTGVVQFFDGTTLLGQGTLNGSGVATFTTSALSTATHPITAVYQGDVKDASSTSTVLNQVVAVPTLQVTSAVATNSGVVITFNQAINPSTLNLYDSGSGTLGAADVTLVGASTGAVRGSLVVGAGNTTVTFIKTGGPLAADTYTLTLRSAANGFVTPTGGLLDGNADGTAGDDFSGPITISSSTALVVGVPDFTRGAGQAVNVPASGTGIPLTISNIAGVTSVQADVLFDSTVLSVTGGTATIAGTTVTVTAITGGVHVSVTGISGATGTNVTVASLTATVPNTAPYANKEIVQVRNVSVNGGALTATGDDAIHVVAYFGDANGSGTLSGGDASLTSQLAVGSGTGLVAFQNADPLLIVDINGNGTISGGDASLISQKAVGLPVSQIPDVPSGVTPPAGGPDPILYLTGGAARPGQTATAQLRLNVTEPTGITLSAVDAAIRFDPSRFRVSNVRVSGLAAGFAIASNVDNATGTIRLSVYTANGVPLAFGVDGAVVLFDLTVLSTARPGASSLNLLQQLGSTVTGAEGPSGRLVLSPAPTDAATDPVDALFVVTLPIPVRDPVPVDVVAGAPAAFAGPDPARVGAADVVTPPVAVFVPPDVGVEDGDWIVAVGRPRSRRIG